MNYEYVSAYKHIVSQDTIHSTPWNRFFQLSNEMHVNINSLGLFPHPAFLSFGKKYKRHSGILDAKKMVWIWSTGIFQKTTKNT